MGMSTSSEKPLKGSYDVAVIGAGVVGCCTARELARFDLDIVVLEAGLDIACGATRANSGIVHVGYDPEPGSAKAHYNIAGAALYPQWQHELGFAYYKNGALVVAFSEEELSVLHELLERSRASYEIPGSRPSGVYSARCALDLLEVSGYTPGHKAFVYGMGDTALECACALADAGVRVLAVADVEDAPIGSDALLRECELRGIALMSGCEVVHIAGANRLEGITVRHQGVEQEIPCDLLIVSKGRVSC